MLRQPLGAVYSVCRQSFKVPGGMQQLRCHQFRSYRGQRGSITSLDENAVPRAAADVLGGMETSAVSLKKSPKSSEAENGFIQ